MSKTSPFSDGTVYGFKDGDYTLECTFPEGKSIPQNTHTVKDGETLLNISYQYYGDSGYWWRIAIENDIVNPLSIDPGTQLVIPQL